MEKAYRRRLRGASNLIGFSFVFMIILVMILEIILNRWAPDVAKKSFFSVLLCAVGIFVSVSIFWFIASRKTKNIMFFKKPKSGWVAYVGVGLGVSVFCSLLASYVVAFLKMFKLASKTPQELLTFDRTAVGMLIYLLSISILPALLEEFMCRGLFIGLLKPFGNGFAVFISSLIFGFIHGNVEQFVFAFLLGLYLGFVAVKTGSLWPSIVLHFLNNLISGTFLVFKGSFTENEIFVSFYYSAVFAVFLVCSMFLFKKIGRSAFLLENNNKSETSLLKKIACFIFTPGMILFILLVSFTIYNSFEAY